MTKFGNQPASYIPAPRRLNVFGTTIDLFLDTARTGGQLTAYRCTVPPQVGPPLHRHEGFDEAFYIVEGTFEVTCGDHVCHAASGSYVFVPRGTTHTFRNVGDTPGVFLGTATPSGHETFFEDADRHAESLTPELAFEVCARNGIEIV